jgi:hypothetical protein
MGRLDIRPLPAVEMAARHQHRGDNYLYHHHHHPLRRISSRTTTSTELLLLQSQGRTLQYYPTNTNNFCHRHYIRPHGCIYFTTTKSTATMTSTIKIISKMSNDDVTTSEVVSLLSTTTTTNDDDDTTADTRIQKSYRFIDQFFDDADYEQTTSSSSSFSISTITKSSWCLRTGLKHIVAVESPRRQNRRHAKRYYRHKNSTNKHENDTGNNAPKTGQYHDNARKPHHRNQTATTNSNATNCC